MGKALEVANQLLSLHSSHGKKHSNLREIVAADVDFTSPMDHVTGIDAYLALHDKLADNERSMRILNQVEQGDTVISVFEATLKHKNGAPVALQMVSTMTFKNGQLASEKVIFDPSPFHKVFGA